MFAKKLDYELERLGYKTVQQKADACGLIYEHMRQVLKGKQLSEERILEVCKALNLSNEFAVELIMAKVQDQAKNPETKEILEGLLNHNRKPKPENKALRPPPDNVIRLEEDFIIPIYNLIKAGDGEMGITEGETEGTITINAEYKKDKVFAVRVSGDSMANELYDGEIAIFKPINGEAIRDRGIYAVEVEGWSSWVVKFVRKDPSGMIQLISANSAFPVKEIDPKISRVTLRGRLIESRRIRK